MNYYSIMSLILGLLSSIAIIYYTSIRRDQDEVKRPGRYKIFFFIGFSWTLVGLANGNEFFWIMGSLFTIVGVAKLTSWKDEPKYKDLSYRDKLVNTYLGFVMFGLLIIGFAYPILKNYNTVIKEYL